MNKNVINCDVIQDLLPLYEDDCCSEQTKSLVEEHLATCENCRKLRCMYHDSIPQSDMTNDSDVKGINIGIKKISRWKRRGIISLCLAIFLILGLIPTWNYINGTGITYANIKATYTAYAFENALIAGDYEKAFNYLDIKSHYEDLISTDKISLINANGETSGNAIYDGIQTIREKGFDWYNQIAKEKFLSNMQALEDFNETIDSYSKFRIYRQPWGWLVHFAAQTASGQELQMQFDIYPDGIYYFSVNIDSAEYNEMTGELITDDVLEQKDLMLSRFYISPTTNETIMKLLYDHTDFDWETLFTY